jgi:hypothetical protein
LPAKSVASSLPGYSLPRGVIKTDSDAWPSYWNAHTRSFRCHSTETEAPWSEWGIVAAYLAIMASTSGTGPWGWENAHAKLAGEPWAGALEIACYTDALWLDGLIASGPYTAMVPLALTEDWPERSGEPRMGLVIRIDRHSDDPDDYIDEAWNQRDQKVAHGGDAGEELAALLSLALGIRLRAGGISRVFRRDDPNDRVPASGRACGSLPSATGPAARAPLHHDLPSDARGRDRSS